ncbi:MAG TPA: histidine--tRNA ligase [Actinobacteria bacterium]|nr:histidine--tRNA ligase [Actinomycetota bacterium]
MADEFSLKAPKGTFDTLPPEGEALLQVRTSMAEGIARAGYAYIETPVLEDTAVFVRGVGESTDVVSKEMYSFTTKGGDDVTLRPEGTAAVMRAVLEHSLHKGALPVKLWYSGSFFRYERPQAGRYRHFSQVGAEAIGSDDPALDAELIATAMDVFTTLGLTRVKLLLNCLGDHNDRPAYRAALASYLDGLDLDAPTRERAKVNPLRVLDDKRPEVQEQLAGVPLVTDYLSADNRAHYDTVRELLSRCGVQWEESPKLVRGLDYYTRTAFEFVHDGLGAQSAVGGGGRYDGLSASLGGPDLPAVGWALGVDRTMLALRAEGVRLVGARTLDVFVVPLGESVATAAFELVTLLRRAGVRADMAVDGRGAKGAMKAANRSAAPLAIVMGDRDVAAGEVQLKDMATGDQTAVPRESILSAVLAALDELDGPTPRRPVGGSA